MEHIYDNRYRISPSHCCLVSQFTVAIHIFWYYKQKQIVKLNYDISDE